MKKTTILALIACFFITNSFKTASEIHWYDFNSGYELAVKKKKTMLVDVYTDWCGWCKVMDRETYAKSEIIDIINKDFVAIKFNPEKKDITYTYEGKKYNGQELAGVIGDYQINGYPATLFINTKTKKKNLIMGYKNAVEFKGILEGFTQK